MIVNPMKKWKLTVNIEKSKIIVFRKGGQLPRNLKFYYDGSELSIVSSFSYLGVVFTPGGSSSLVKLRTSCSVKLRKPFLD